MAVEAVSDRDDGAGGCPEHVWCPGCDRLVPVTATVAVYIDRADISAALLSCPGCASETYRKAMAA